MKCPRCKGRVFHATDEFGTADTHCIVCGWRLAPTWTPEQLERIALALVKNGRTESFQRKAAQRVAL